MNSWVLAVSNVGVGTAMCYIMVRFTNNLTNHLVTATLPELVKTFADQLQKEREAAERQHADAIRRFDFLEAAQAARHAENLATLKELRHMVRATDGALATFMAVVGEHLGLIRRGTSITLKEERHAL